MCWADRVIVDFLDAIILLKGNKHSAKAQQEEELKEKEEEERAKLQ